MSLSELLSEVERNLRHSEKVTGDHLTEIDRFIMQGDSVGAAVSKHMLQTSGEIFSSLGEELSGETESSPEQAYRALITILFYRLIPRAVLDAEDVIKFGEPEQIPTSEISQEADEEIDTIAKIISTSLGYIIPPDPAQYLIAETQYYLNRITLGRILRETNSPLAVVDHVENKTLMGLDNGALRLDQSGELDESEKGCIITAAVSCLKSKDRFNMLFKEVSK